jgi:lysophospholipase L1-like esterase
MPTASPLAGPIIFYGDSITDCGRARDQPTALGHGYVAQIAARLDHLQPDPARILLNRGISGNRIGDLESRLDADVLAHRPALVSVLIGINDTWRAFDRNDPTTTAAFRLGYTRLLTRLRDAGVPRIVLLEPFLLPTPPDRRAWREDLDPKIGVVRDLAVEFDTTFLPLDGLFAAAATRAPAAHWLPDGVHPSPGGHALIADVWLQALDA